MLRTAARLLLVLLLGTVGADAFCSRPGSCTCHGDERQMFMSCSDGTINIYQTVAKFGQFSCDSSTVKEDLERLEGVFLDGVTSLAVDMCPLSDEPIAHLLRISNAGIVNTLTFHSDRTLGDTLNSRHFSGFSAVRLLDISNNGLTSLPSDIFSGMPRLQTISFANNVLRYLREDIFQNLTDLVSIDLTKNHLTTFPSGVLRNLPKLGRLKLLNNRLTSVPTVLFKDLTGLVTIDLRRNYLTELQSDVFKNLPLLEEIYLDENNFTTLPSRVLAKCHNLKIFRLCNNRGDVLRLSPGFFSNLPNIQHVSIRSNKLHSVPEDLFWGSLKLEVIHLSNNNLVELPGKLFYNVTGLMNLDLSYNKLRNLSTLDLTSLQRLDNLTLSNNFLDSIGALPANLKMLDLSNNTLTHLGCSKDPSHVSPLKICHKLQRLLLARNNLSTVCVEWMRIPTLAYIDLSHNSLRRATWRRLPGTNNASRLRIDVSHNNISVLPVSELQNSATTWRLTGNPLTCNHLNYELFVLLKEVPPRAWLAVEDAANALCAEPPSVAGLPVTAVDERAVLHRGACHVPACDCHYRPHDRALVVDCAGRNLTAAPAALPELGSHTELLLAGNALHALPDFGSPGYQAVTELDLSHNGLASLHGARTLPRHLEVIKLNDNRLTSIDQIDVDAIANLTRLVSLTLYNNPWKCECHHIPLVTFRLNEWKKVLNSSATTCEDGRLLLTVAREPCSNYVFWTPFLVPALLGSLSAVAIAIYLKYTRELKAWLYTHDICLQCVTEEELDSDLRYDVFISYSHRDEQFVVNELMPALEGGRRPLSTCVHIRDFVPGLPIHAEVLRCVHESRRTLVVLSPSFLESVWGRVELRAAYCQALVAGRARVVVLLLEDVGPTDRLDPELRAYLGSNTYVQWGDPWFWEKLRYALPHQRPHRGRRGAADDLGLKPIPGPPASGLPPATVA